MRKFVCILFVAILAISFCACNKSKNSGYDKEQQLRDQIGQLEDEYDKAKENADKFQQDVQDYYDALNDLEKYN